MSDLIRRQEVIIALRESGLCYNNWLEVLGVIDAVPSADKKQVTGKLKNRDDSYLTADAEAVKERKSKLDLISRQDAVKVLNDRQYDIRAFIEKEDMEYKEAHSYWCEIHGIYNSIELIESLPSAKPKTGEWEEVEDYNGDIHYQCNQCKNEFILIDGTPQDNDYKYCPNCGAKMRGEEE